MGVDDIANRLFSKILQSDARGIERRFFDASVTDLLEIELIPKFVPGEYCVIAQATLNNGNENVDGIVNEIKSFGTKDEIYALSSRVKNWVLENCTGISLTNSYMTNSKGKKIKTRDDFHEQDNPAINKSEGIKVKAGAIVTGAVGYLLPSLGSGYLTYYLTNSPHIAILTGSIVAGTLGAIATMIVYRMARAADMNPHEEHSRKRDFLGEEVIVYDKVTLDEIQVIIGKKIDHEFKGTFAGLSLRYELPKPNLKDWYQNRSEGVLFRIPLYDTGRSDIIASATLSVEIKGKKFLFPKSSTFGKDDLIKLV